MKNYFKTLDGFATMEDQGELFKELLKNLKPNDKLKIAEIGVYKGRMTVMICDILSDMGIKAEYYCIDHFKGSAEHIQKNYYPEFSKNISGLDFDDIRVIPIPFESSEAACHFKDCSLDIVYLDASHDYSSVKTDITAWLPKVRKGGIICGDDYISGWDGVIQAVDEAFGKENIKRVGNQQWWIRL